MLTYATAEALAFYAERIIRGVSIDVGLQFARDRKRRIETLVQALQNTLDNQEDGLFDEIQCDLQDELYELNREAYLYDSGDNDDDFWGLSGFPGRCSCPRLLRV